MERRLENDENGDVIFVLAIDGGKAATARSFNRWDNLTTLMNWIEASNPYASNYSLLVMRQTAAVEVPDTEGTEG